MKIERYVKLVIRKWWIIVLLEVIALGATYYYVSRQALTYTSTATLILNPKSTNSIIPFTDSDISSVTSLAENYNLVLKSETFLNQVIAKLGFDISQDDLKKAFTSKLTPNTLFYYISATAHTPEQAQKIASTVTQVFLQNQTDNNKDTSQSSATTLKNQQDAYNSLTAEIADIDNQLKDLQNQTASADVQAKISSLQDRRRILIVNQSQALLAINQLKNSGTSSSDYAVLYTEARLPDQADASNLLRNLLFAFALALALSLGVIFLLDYLDGSVRSRDDLVNLTGKAPLAVIPEIALPKPAKPGNLNGNGKHKKGETADPVETSQKLALHNNNKSEGKLDNILVTAGVGYSPAAEAFRTLRTNMLFSNVGDKLDKPINSVAKSFLVTSALPGEGRSVTAANLAIAFAQTGKKVILIDGDLRHPSLHNLFNLNNETGFSDLAISGITKLTKAVHSTSIQNLVVVTAGNSLTNPSELLTSTKATNVIKFFKNIADIVIFDSPPVSLVTDASVLANMVDQVVLVVEHHVTQRTMVQNTMLELSKVGAKLEGIILNRVKEKKSRRLSKYFNYQPARTKSDNHDKTAKSAIEDEASKEHLNIS